MFGTCLLGPVPCADGLVAFAWLDGCGGNLQGLQLPLNRLCELPCCGIVSFVCLVTTCTCFVHLCTFVHRSTHSSVDCRQAVLACAGTLCATVTAFAAFVCHKRAPESVFASSCAVGIRTHAVFAASALRGLQPAGAAVYLAAEVAAAEVGARYCCGCLLPALCTFRGARPSTCACPRPPARPCHSPQEDERMLQDIQRFYNTVIEELPSNVADLI